MTTPITYYGGKSRMVPHILPRIPKKGIKTYVEAFAGGAAVFFAKTPSPIEMLNDVNGNVANFYRTMQQSFEELCEMIEHTLHCEWTHREATEIYYNPAGHSLIKRAWAFWVCCNMSFGACPGENWQFVGNSKDNWQPAITTQRKREAFKYYANRLAKVQIHNKPAEILISKVDAADCFFYCDPPYINARQGHYAGYTEEHYAALLIQLSQIKGRFLLSSYHSDILADFTKANVWHTVEVPQRLDIVAKRLDKIEVLTANYPIKTKPVTKKIDLFTIKNY